MSTLTQYLEMLASNPGGGGMVPQSAAIWDALLCAQREAGFQGDIAEIGVYKGYGASLAAAYAERDERIVLIDRYFGLEHSIAAFRQIAGPDVEQRIDFHLADSLALLRRPEFRRERAVRFLHIDGEHSYDAVMNDLHLAAGWLDPDGCVAVDDVFNFATPQVTHALFEFLREPGHNLSAFLFGFNKAYLCFNRRLGVYRQATERANDACIALGHRTQLCACGFALERTYFSISPAVNDERYQLIGRFSSDRAELLSGLGGF